MEGKKTYDADDEAFAERSTGSYIVTRGNNSEDVEHDKSSDCGDEVDGATAEFVDEEGEKEVFAEGEGFHAAVDAELRVGICQADVVHDVLEVVGNQAVAAPLTEETNGGDDGDSLAVALGLEEVGPAGGVLLFVEVDGRADLGIFELDEFIVLVSFTVPFGEDSEGLFVAVFVAQPTRGFGHEGDEGDDDQGANCLEK